MCLTEPDVDSQDYYKVLGVQRGATCKEIGAAYKRLALRYHPDKNINNRDQAEHAFKRVTLAYENLRDSSKREAYDKSSNDQSYGPQINANGIPGDFGSFERADELYRMFFSKGTNTGSVHNIDIAGIFDFDRNTRAKTKTGVVKPSTPAHVILAGTQVVVHGLESKPEFNGKSARIREWNAGKGRYEVSLTSGDVLSLRPRCLTQLCYITVHGDESQSELHGKRGEIVDFNEDSGSYVVLLSEPPSIVELPPRNCVFPAGTPGVLQNLSDEQLNGLMCSIVSVVESTSRYLVQCEGGRQLKVRFEKLMC